MIDIYIMIHLITSFYLLVEDSDQKIRRNIELKETLQKNLDSDIISKIHLFLDCEELIPYIKNLNNFNKIHIIKTGKQPFYSDMFIYANENLKDNICMISNSDIYIYEYDLDCLNKIDKNIYTLTRHENDLSCPLIDEYRGSHDVFIFKSPINCDYERINHVQNVWGSENSVIDMLVETGNNLVNPCRQIKIVHLHTSGYRNEDRIRIRDGNYFFPPQIV